jgi:hypothetical protein
MKGKDKMAGGKGKVPGLVMLAVVCLGLGAAAGVAVVVVYGQQVRPAVPAQPLSGRAKATLAVEKEMQKKLEEDAAKTPAKANLAALVVKLDYLATSPLKLNLDEKQRQGVVEQLNGLADLGMLPEEDAGKRLFALQQILNPDQEVVLYAAGFLWPGGVSVQEQTRSHANPFRIPEVRKHLRDLEKQLKTEG